MSILREEEEDVKRIFKVSLSLSQHTFLRRSHFVRRRNFETRHKIVFAEFHLNIISKNAKDARSSSSWRDIQISCSNFCADKKFTFF